MQKKFNPKITEIKTIGDELRFQREYYNFKNAPYKLIPRKAVGGQSKFLGDVLENYLTDNFQYMSEGKSNNRDNYGEYGCNEDILYAIEHEKFKNENKNGKYNIQTYCLRIYSLFKIYGFLDDYEILVLLDKYNVKPKFNKTEIEINRLKENCFNDYENNLYKSAFNIILCSKSTNTTDVSELIKNFSKFNFLCSKQNIKDLMNYDFRKCRFLNYSNFKRQMKNNFNALSEIDRKYTSLELRQETSFIDDILQDKIKYVTFDTIFNILHILKLENTDLEYLLNKEIELNLKCKKHNILEIEKDIFNFRKMWKL